MPKLIKDEPESRRSELLKWLLIVIAVGVLLFFRYYLATLADGGRTLTWSRRYRAQTKDDF